MPSGNAFGSSYQPTKLSLSALVAHVGAGKAWTPGYFSGHSRDRKTFLSSQLLALDFDQDVSVKQALQTPFIKRYAFFVYSTPTSTVEHPRTRIVFLLSEPVMRWQQWEALQRGLIDHFLDLKPDTVCKDATRMFYGSTVEGAYVNYEAVLPIEVAGNLTRPEGERDHQQHYAAKNILIFPKQTGTSGGKVSSKLVEEVENRLRVNQATYNENGFTVEPIACPVKNHENDHERPAAYWHSDKKCLYCHKCGQTYNTHQIAAAIGIDIGSYYRYDHLPDDPSIVIVEHRYITEYKVMALIDQGVTRLLIKSPTGSGKTELIKQFRTLDYPRILIITHRRSLVADGVKRMNENIGSQVPFVSYDGLSNAELQQAPRLCICINSLHKLIRVNQPIPVYDLLVFDEVEQQLKHLTGGTFEGAEPVIALQTATSLMEEAKVVLALDAYASPLTFNWMKEACDQETFRMLINDVRLSKGNLHRMKNMVSLMKCADEVLTTSETEGPIVFAVSSKATAKWLYSYFTGQPILSQQDRKELITEIDPQFIEMLALSPHHISQSKVQIVYGDNTDTQSTHEFVGEIDARLPGLKVLIHTSAMGTGIDIQAVVKAVFGIFKGGILPADEVLQMLARCRKASEFYVFLENKTGNHETSPEKLYQNQMKKILMTGSVLGSSYHIQWHRDEIGMVQMDQNQQKYLHFWSHVTSTLNQSHNSFRQQFMAMVSREFVIEKRDGSEAEEMDEAETELAAILEQIKAGVKGVDQYLILTCPPISKSNYEQVQRDYAVTPAIFAGHIRWQIERGYRQGITPSLYEHWLKGGLGHLYHFIRLHTSAVELQEFDLRQAVVGYAIPRRSHATARTKMIQAVFKYVFGSYRHLERSGSLTKMEIDERLLWYVQKFENELRIQFNWRTNQDMDSMNVLRRLASDLGLKLVKNRAGINKGKYGICRESLATMQSYYDAYQKHLAAQQEITIAA